ncbi:MAG: transposase [Parabacteroides sp.]|nr:transposase [Parabacteroides sp.]
MAFIRIQKGLKNAEGVYVGGSAQLMKSVYCPNKKFHSKHEAIENLGKIVFYDKDRKIGVFISPTRGLIEYDVKSEKFSQVKDDDPRLPKEVKAPPSVHKEFGDAYLLLDFIKKSGLNKVLSKTFQQERLLKRVYVHLLHGILRDSSKISCDNFYAKSVISDIFPGLLPSILKTDSSYFEELSNDQTRIDFFKNYTEFMREKNPDFGKVCYVDSTPLPNEIAELPFNAMASHGLDNIGMQTRLALVLDEPTGMPLWYNLFPGNVLDINTIETVLADVSVSIGFTLSCLILDAGYVSKELLLKCHNGTPSTFIGRMPARRGYGYKTLFDQCQPLISRGKYMFTANHHLYFGHKKTVQLFNQPIYAYVFVDQENATQRVRQFINQDEEEFEQLSPREKDYLRYKFGFFVLLSNIDDTPKAILQEYFCRTRIEEIFKLGKDHLKWLPLSKWNCDRVKGKLLHDMIELIVTLNFRKAIESTGESVSEIIGSTQSLMGIKTSENIIKAEYPNAKTKKYYELLGLTVPKSVELDKTVAAFA